MRICVIDDNQSDIDLLRHAFSVLPACHVTAYCDGDDALSALSDSHPPYDLILSDWKLGSVSGESIVTRFMEGRDRATTPPVVVFSSLMPACVEERLQEIGVKTLPKPTDLDGFESFVQEIVAIAEMRRF